MGGNIKIEAGTPAALSRSIVNMVVEIFTQMRNCTPRKKLALKTGMECLKEARTNPLSKEEKATIKEKLAALASRLTIEQHVPLVSSQKKEAIKQAIFAVNPPDEATFQKRLSCSVYSASLILGAIAIFKTQTQKHPDKKYGLAYFGGILRNLADQESVECLNANLIAVFYHHWESCEQKSDMDICRNLGIDPKAMFIELAKDYIKSPIPAFSDATLLQMKEYYYLAVQGITQIASTLRESISKMVLNLTFEARKKRERLLLAIFGWESKVRLFAAK